MINKDRGNFQYRGGDLVYIISPLTSQLHMVSHKIAAKYVGPVVVYKIVDPHNYLIMTLDGKILRGIFEHEIETCHHQNKSRKCPKSSRAQANYEYQFKV